MLQNEAVMLQNEAVMPQDEAVPVRAFSPMELPSQCS
jgi:hypothetical protein